MKIRSITYFCHPGWPLRREVLQHAGHFLNEARQLLGEAGYEVQTTRLATVPFPQLVAGKWSDVPALARALEQALAEQGIQYAALGPAQAEILESFDALVEAIAATENIFFSANLLNARQYLVLPAVGRTAETILRLSTVEAHGFANLRFAALVNVPPGTPFFPAAYHQGDEAAFALALEAADLALEAFEGAKTLDEGRQRLVARVEQEAQRLARLANFLKYRHMVRFGGFDFSLAPFPQPERSIGAALEQMGVPRLGLHGSLAAVALLAESLERARFPHAGFCGVMLPVLEDAVLAERVAQGELQLKDLLLYAAACGTGLDTVPLPGDVSAAQLTALLLDLAMLSLRLNKPLTARLMPIPGKKAAEATDFDFPFFANSKTLPLTAQGLGALWQGKEVLEVRARPAGKEDGSGRGG